MIMIRKTTKAAPPLANRQNASSQPGTYGVERMAQICGPIVAAHSPAKNSSHNPVNNPNIDQRPVNSRGVFCEERVWNCSFANSKAWVKSPARGALEEHAGDRRLGKLDPLSPLLEQFLRTLGDRVQFPPAAFQLREQVGEVQARPAQGRVGDRRRLPFDFLPLLLGGLLARLEAGDRVAVRGGVQFFLVAVLRVELFRGGAAGRRVLRLRCGKLALAALRKLPRRGVETPLRLLALRTEIGREANVRRTPLGHQAAQLGEQIPRSVRVSNSTMVAVAAFLLGGGERSGEPAHGVEQVLHLRFQGGRVGLLKTAIRLVAPRLLDVAARLVQRLEPHLQLPGRPGEIASPHASGSAAAARPAAADFSPGSAARLAGSAAAT